MWWRRQSKGKATSQKIDVGIWGKIHSDPKVKGGNLSPGSASPWIIDFGLSESAALQLMSQFLRLISGNMCTHLVQTELSEHFWDSPQCSQSKRRSEMAASVSKFESSQICWWGCKKVLAGAGNCVSSFKGRPREPSCCSPRHWMVAQKSLRGRCTRMEFPVWDSVTAASCFEKLLFPGVSKPNWPKVAVVTLLTGLNWGH